MNIDHTLWVFDTIVGLRDHRNKSLPDALKLLNGAYLSYCQGAVPGGSAHTIVSAIGKQVTGSQVSPSAFDAVVFLVKDPTQSFGPKIGGTAANQADVLGRTFLGAAGGGLAEVYWDLCRGNNELAAAIFHEAAHLKSGLGQQMHTATVGAPHGGPGLRVLRANGASFFAPSGDDCDFYSIAIPNRIALRTKPP